MPEGKHTPKPWAFVDGAIHHDDGDVMPRIASVEYDNTSEEQYLADGALLAAAPDLLEALEAIMDSIPRGGELEIYIHPTDVENARAALAKAQPPHGGRG